MGVSLTSWSVEFVENGKRQYLGEFEPEISGDKYTAIAIAAMNSIKRSGSGFGIWAHEKSRLMEIRFR